MFYSGEIARGFGLRLLVVDDNEEITDVITLYFSTDQNIECEVINDGPQGLERIRNDNFDLILLEPSYAYEFLYSSKPS